MYLERVWQCGCGCFSNSFSCRNKISLQAGPRKTSNHIISQRQKASAIRRSSQREREHRVSRSFSPCCVVLPLLDTMHVIASFIFHFGDSTLFLYYFISVIDVDIILCVKICFFYAIYHVCEVLKNILVFNKK